MAPTCELIEVAAVDVRPFWADVDVEVDVWRVMLPKVGERGAILDGLSFSADGL
jgi:hypothetical protein